MEYKEKKMKVRRKRKETQPREGREKKNGR